MGNGGEDDWAFCGGSGSDEKSLKELSDCRGAFQGNRRSVIQQKIMARDQISAGCGSYLISLHTSGARYGSDPTIPRHDISKIHLWTNQEDELLTTGFDDVIFEGITEHAGTPKIDNF